MFESTINDVNMPFFSLLRLIFEILFFRFECEKLILVGDPKQLPPTIQGSDAAHENGLEQTLFDRLCLMVHTAKYLYKYHL
jgi:superfamily I DNA and/or RNA helicase